MTERTELQKPERAGAAAANRGATLPWGKEHGPGSVAETIPHPHLPGAAPDELSIQDTLHMADSGSGSPPVDRSAPTPSSRNQTTVLPRVTMQGAVPTFVTDDRVRYEVGALLGEGGVGQVFNAHDHDIDRKVALKRLQSHVQSPVGLARFVDEIRTTGRLAHPNIIPIHDVGVDENGEYYFVMKHVAGETLEEIIEKLRAGDAETHRRYGFEHRVELFKNVLEAVAFAHSQGIIHRDIKPANVMVGAFGEVLLMDWGLAKSIRGGSVGVDDALLAAEGAAGNGGNGDAGGRVFETQVGALLGTPAYMAPEQAQGKPADEQSDIYSLCVMFHELLCLEHYLSDTNTLAEALAGVVDKPVPNASFVKSPHQPAVPADLQWFVSAGVAKDPEKRFPSVLAMIDRLDRRAEGDIPVQCPMTAMKLATNKWTRFLDSHPVVVVVMVVLTALAVVGALALGITRLVS
ncbi:MAG: serine/threonine-protein kinase [bacterium]